MFFVFKLSDLTVWCVIAAILYNVCFCSLKCSSQKHHRTLGLHFLFSVQSPSQMEFFFTPHPKGLIILETDGDSQEFKF